MRYCTVLLRRVPRYPFLTNMRMAYGIGIAQRMLPSPVQYCIRTREEVEPRVALRNRIGTCHAKKTSFHHRHQQLTLRFRHNRTVAILHAPNRRYPLEDTHQCRANAIAESSCEGFLLEQASSPVPTFFPLCSSIYAMRQARQPYQHMANTVSFSSYLRLTSSSLRAIVNLAHPILSLLSQKNSSPVMSFVYLVVSDQSPTLGMSLVCVKTRQKQGSTIHLTAKR
jgi:hypothetical protein